VTAAEREHIATLEAMLLEAGTAVARQVFNTGLPDNEREQWATLLKKIGAIPVHHA
jgi:hypothetical protein